eukprot:TRINITY_DN3004_c0_g1_i1.p1 TRINITY_DN3004_c0_g1~~TRINITY_DN3004_c0_g1_i1.p1  ORF type:complete len:260 (+),score=79.20 TRINITY_DN3004_c0_g1_i1:114-782(+)
MANDNATAAAAAASEYPFAPDPAIFVILSGPSGAGKSTVMDCFMKTYGTDFVRCLSATTRAPRPKKVGDEQTMEQNGVDYLFLADAEFDKRIAENGFLEHAVVFGKSKYGTPRAFVEENLAAGKSVVKDVDVQGAAQVRKTFPAAVHVFLTAPSAAEIERRLRGRGSDPEEVILRRLAEGQREWSKWRDFDYVVLNDVPEKAAERLANVVAAERLRIARCHK